MRNDKQEEKSESYGWIQWKGTSVCMDIHCECGEIGHVDAEFLYYVRCPNCKKVFKVSGTVRLFDVPPDESNEAEERAVTAAGWDEDTSSYVTNPEYEPHSPT